MRKRTFYAKAAGWVERRGNQVIAFKEPSLRGGAADAAIQKVFTGTDAALLDCHAAGAARNDGAEAQ